MRVVILSFGRGVKHTPWQLLCDDYTSRVERFVKLDSIESREDRPDKIEQVVQNTLTSIGPRAMLVVLDVQGKSFTSEAFAKKFGEILDGANIPVFVIGGAEGLPESVRSKARLKISLGPMTLPHKLARLLLSEQIYRAGTILRGEPYARES